VHVRTLRAAAHDVRLAATFGQRPFFGKLSATATREAVRTKQVLPSFGRST